MDFFPSLCLARMHFQGIVGNYDRNSWQSRNWRERDGLCLTKEGGWICRKQTGTPVINSRNQRYMAHPSITTAKETILLHFATEICSRPIYQHATLLQCNKCIQQHLSLLQNIYTYTHFTGVADGGKLRHSYCRNGFIVVPD